MQELDRPNGAEDWALPSVDSSSGPTPPLTVQPAESPFRPAAVPGIVSLQDVIARETVVLWPEAVAIVEELCVTLGRNRAHIVPEPSEILITLQGAVVAGSSAAEGSPGARLGSLLQTLLATAPTVPAPLRVLATAAVDAYSSIEQFAEALAFFGRPDRKSLIHAAVDRFLTTAATVSDGPTIEARRAAGPQVSTRPLLRSIARAAGAAVLVIAALAGAVWLWPAVAERVRAIDSAALFDAFSKKGSEPVSATTDDRAPRPAAPRAMRRSARAGPSVDTPPLEMPNTQAATPRTGLASGMLPSAEGPSSATSGVRDTQEFDAAAQSPGGADGLREPGTADRPLAVATRGRGLAEPTVARAEATVVYSSKDADVRPPVLVDARMPQTPLDDMDTAWVDMLELLVAEDGSVERVKMLNRPRRMADMMILSGAKMWRFQPASKDGRPVKYVTVLRWTVTP